MAFQLSEVGQTTRPNLQLSEKKLTHQQTQESAAKHAAAYFLAERNSQKESIAGAQSLRTQTPENVMRLKDVVKRLGLSRSAIYDRLDLSSKRHDATFPAQIRLGTNGRAVGWLSSEIEAWLVAQIATSRTSH
jgi:prophage regulatory protein